MKNHFLVLKACRWTLFNAMLLGVAVPLLLVSIVITLLSNTIADGVEDFLSEATPWLIDHAFSCALYMALLAAIVPAFAGFHAAMAKLPIPLTMRQQAYFPLALSLVIWSLLLGILGTIIFAGLAMSGRVGGGDTITSTIAALPAGLLLIVLANRNVGRLSSQMGLWMTFNLYPQIALMGGSEQKALSHYAYDSYITVWPFLVALVLLLVWDLPAQRQNWYRAVFTAAPAGLKRIQHREHLAPQRLQPVRLFIDALDFLITRLIDLAFFAMMISILYHSFGFWENHAGRMPLWTEQLLWALAGMFILLAIGFYGGKITLPYLQTGRYSTDGAWAQFILRMVWYLERSPNRRHTIHGKIVQWAPDFNKFVLHAQAKSDGPAPEKSIRRNVGNTLFLVFASQFVLILSMNNFTGVDVGFNREGSHIAGDIQAEPDKDYDTDSTFSQHYVTLDLGETATAAERDQAFAAIQNAVSALPDVTDWVDELTTVAGQPALPPQRYRIEIARPEARRVVIQSIGLHWDHAGPLAYGLAHQILKQLDGSLSVRLDPDYHFYRIRTAFRPAYGFLDNGVHWVQRNAERAPAAGQVPPPLATDTPVYVDVRNTDGWENGKSWATAYDTIQEGIAAAYRRRVRSVWVAAGAYGEEGYGDGSLLMLPGVHVYGGFAGDETIRTQRDVYGQPTTIDGSRSKKGGPTYHVVIASSDATLDGFTITGGRALGADYGDDHGAGMVIEDCWPVIRHCTFIDNEARFGAAVYMTDGGATFDRCRFLNNRAREYGSAVWNSNKNLSFENCLFAGNECDKESGDVIFAQDFFMKNCTLIGSQEGDNSLFRDGPDASRFINCIMVNPNQPFEHSDSNISFSIVQGGAPGQGNLDLDPRFVDPDNGDYRLRPDSPAIDAGNSEDAAAVDLDGNPRLQGSGVDMGAYEFVPQ